MRPDPQTTRAAAPPADAPPPELHRDFDAYALTADRVQAVYQDLRENTPVAWSDHYGGFWILSRYRDVVAALKDPTTFISGEGVHLPRRAGPIKPTPLEVDPPEHTFYRNLLAEVLSQPSVNRLTPAIRGYVAELLAPLAARGGGDFVEEVAVPLPLQVVCQVLGLSREALRTIRQLTASMWHDFHLLGNDARRPLADFLLGEVRARMQEPREDFLSVLAHTKFDGRPLTESELGSLVVTLAAAGHETTMNAIGLTLHHLAENPDVQARLRAEPTRIPTYVEESLRYHTPAHMFARTLTRDVTVEGVTLRKGDRVVLIYASANHDPEQFPEPEQFDLQRRGANRHLTFGWGIHFCLGAPLARLELRILLEELFAHHPPFHLAGPAPYSPMEGGHHLGVTALPLAFESAA